jgi:hypothetical protein
LRSASTERNYFRLLVAHNGKRFALVTYVGVDS